MLMTLESLRDEWCATGVTSVLFRINNSEVYGKVKSGKHSFGAVPECLFSACVISLRFKVSEIPFGLKC